MLVGKVLGGGEMEDGFTSPLSSWGGEHPAATAQEALTEKPTTSAPVAQASL